MGILKILLAVLHSQIDKNKCDGTVMHYQSTNLLQVKRAMILCLEKRDLARGASKDGGYAKSLVSVLITIIGVTITYCLHM